MNDTVPGIQRRRNGKAFAYFDTKGRLLRSAAVLKRIRSLVVPPAWRDVWICPDPEGHIQATGVDARGRKQYRYHPRWREVRDANKYDRLLEFAGVLPRIRSAVARDLRRPGLPREKVLAALVRLLETTFIRIGNEEYARENRSYGLTTLQDRHVSVRTGGVRFAFRGKSGVEHTIGLEDRRLAEIVRQCQDLAGQELFQYLDEEGRVRDVKSDDVNAYIDTVSRKNFSPKDFRTWGGTVLAAAALHELGPAETKRDAKRLVAGAVKAVSARLGNTPAVCRKSYIHPAVIDAYLNGELDRYMASRSGGKGAGRGLRGDESAVVRLLDNRSRVRLDRGPKTRA